MFYNVRPFTVLDRSVDKPMAELLPMLGPTPTDMLSKPMPREMKRDWLDKFTAPFLGSILAPWMNRIEGGRYSFQGTGSHCALYMRL